MQIPRKFVLNELEKFNISEKKPPIKKITSVLKPANNRRIFSEKNLWKSKFFFSVLSVNSQVQQKAIYHILYIVCRLC